MNLRIEYHLTDNSKHSLLTLEMAVSNLYKPYNTIFQKNKMEIK